MGFEFLLTKRDLKELRTDPIEVPVRIVIHGNHVIVAGNAGGVGVVADVQLYRWAHPQRHRLHACAEVHIFVPGMGEMERHYASGFTAYGISEMIGRVLAAAARLGPGPLFAFCMLRDRAGAGDLAALAILNLRSRIRHRLRLSRTMQSYLNALYEVAKDLADEINMLGDTPAVLTEIDVRTGRRVEWVVFGKRGSYDDCIVACHHRVTINYYGGSMEVEGVVFYSVNVAGILSPLLRAYRLDYCSITLTEKKPERRVWVSSDAKHTMMRVMRIFMQNEDWDRWPEWFRRAMDCLIAYLLVNN